MRYTSLTINASKYQNPPHTYNEKEKSLHLVWILICTIRHLAKFLNSFFRWKTLPPIVPLDICIVLQVASGNKGNPDLARWCWSVLVIWLYNDLCRYNIIGHLTSCYESTRKIMNYIRDTNHKNKICRLSTLDMVWWAEHHLIMILKELMKTMLYLDW